jgi:hypothetical protein
MPTEGRALGLEGVLEGTSDREIDDESGDPAEC